MFELCLINVDLTLSPSDHISSAFPYFKNLSLFFLIFFRFILLFSNKRDQLIGKKIDNFHLFILNPNKFQRLRTFFYFSKTFKKHKFIHFPVISRRFLKCAYKSCHLVVVNLKTHGLLMS